VSGQVLRWLPLRFFFLVVAFLFRQVRGQSYRVNEGYFPYSTPNLLGEKFVCSPLPCLWLCAVVPPHLFLQLFLAWLLCQKNFFPPSTDTNALFFSSLVQKSLFVAGFLSVKVFVFRHSPVFLPHFFTRSFGELILEFKPHPVRFFVVQKHRPLCHFLPLSLLFFSLFAICLFTPIVIWWPFRRPSPSSFFLTVFYTSLFYSSKVVSFYATSFFGFFCLFAFFFKRWRRLVSVPPL